MKLPLAAARISSDSEENASEILQEWPEQSGVLHLCLYSAIAMHYASQWEVKHQTPPSKGYQKKEVLNAYTQECVCLWGIIPSKFQPEASGRSTVLTSAMESGFLLETSLFYPWISA